MPTGSNFVTAPWWQRYFSVERSIPHARALNILFRTGHLLTFAILVGGHVVGAPLEQLRWLLYGTILSCAGMGALDLYMTPALFFEGRGVFLILNLGLLCLVPIFWNHRVAILVAVVVIASIGSHMPGKYRHYSFLYRKVVN